MSAIAGSQLFPALLRYWRTRRGLSQLELALAADVSARHISFLESARARPSEEMVLRLFTVMGVPLREQNMALTAAGHAARFAAPADGELPPEIDHAIVQMMAQNEPFPLVAFSLEGAILRQNRGATTVFREFVAAPEEAPIAAPDIYSMLFDTRLMRPFIVGWESFARNIVARLHREQLVRGDARLAAVLDRIFAHPGVSEAWRQPDFSTDLAPVLSLHLSRGDLEVRFLVALTTFSTGQQVPFDDLRIESCFPLDEETRATCRRLAS